MLSAATVRTIEGSGPYLTFDGGLTRVATTDGFLGIKIGEVKVTALDDISTVDAPIIIPDSYTFADIETLVPLPSEGYPEVALNDLVNIYDYWGDDSGNDTPSATGKLTLSWSILGGRHGITNWVKETPSSKMILCNSPYRLRLSSTGGILSTQYGAPNSTVFTAATHNYYIQTDGIDICWAQPDFRSVNGVHNTVNSTWYDNKGFIRQLTDAKNFPTTGSNGLYFDLVVTGVDATTLSWSPVTVGGITATPVVTTSKTVKVTLTGPAATMAQQHTLDPGSVAKPTLPARFEIKGTSAGSTTVAYGFEIKKWFINRGSVYGTSSNGINAVNAAAWCTGTGYRVPRVAELTNAKGDGWPPNTITNPRYNYCDRNIDDGLFCEWGNMSNYTGSGFLSTVYWTGDMTDEGHFGVSSTIGGVRNYIPATRAFAICTF